MDMDPLLNQWTDMDQWMVIGHGPTDEPIDGHGPTDGITEGHGPTDGPMNARKRIDKISCTFIFIFICPQDECNCNEAECIRKTEDCKHKFASTETCPGGKPC